MTSTPFLKLMSGARRSDGLLSAKQTMALVRLISKGRDGRSVGGVVRDLTAIYPAVWSKAQNTIHILMAMGFVSEKDGLIYPADAAALDSDLYSSLGLGTARVLAARLSERGIARCLQSKFDDGLWMDSMLVPGAVDGLSLWIVEFGVASRESIQSRFWKLSATYEPIFLAGIRASNRDFIQRSLTPTQLREKQRQNELDGEEAEKWVLDYERHRLSGHRLGDQIRRVSEDSVSAGFDILSFSSVESLQHDLFIEVKSFIGEKRFFWSRNEVQVAMSLGENYCLYIVDRLKMNSIGYHPQIIPGPYSAMMQTADNGWHVEPSTYEFRWLG